MSSMRGCPDSVQMHEYAPRRVEQGCYHAIPSKGKGLDPSRLAAHVVERRLEIRRFVNRPLSPHCSESIASLARGMNPECSGTT